MNFQNYYKEAEIRFAVPDAARWAKRMKMWNAAFRPILRHIAKVGSIIDFGCGAGDLVVSFQAYEWSTLRFRSVFIAA